MRKELYQLSVDPGLAGTGWALWEEEGDLVGAGNVYSKEKEIEKQCVDLVSNLYDIIDNTVGMEKIVHIYCEYPAVFGGVSGQMVAMKGDVVKLAVFCGFLIGNLDKDFTYVPVNVWKGQLPKPVVVRRIKKIVSLHRLSKEPKSHTWDAIGIGLWAQGRF